MTEASYLCSTLQDDIKFNQAQLSNQTFFYFLFFAVALCIDSSAVSADCCHEWRGCFSHTGLKLDLI